MITLHMPCNFRCVNIPVVEKFDQHCCRKTPRCQIPAHRAMFACWPQLGSSGFPLQLGKKVLHGQRCWHLQGKSERMARIRQGHPTWMHARYFAVNDWSCKWRIEKPAELTLLFMTGCSRYHRVNGLSARACMPIINLLHEGGEFTWCQRKYWFLTSQAVLVVLVSLRLFDNAASCRENICIITSTVAVVICLSVHLGSSAAQSVPVIWQT